MWGSAGAGPELLCDGWLYHALSNGDGLHLKAGEYCEYQWTKAAPVEVWLSMQPKNKDAEREEEQRRLRVAIANQALLNKGMRNNAGENNCFLNVCIQGERVIVICIQYSSKVSVIVIVMCVQYSI